MTQTAVSPRPTFIIPSLILAVALITLGIFGLVAVKEARSPKLIVIKGFAEKQITSDYGTWSASLTVRGPVLAAASNKLEGDQQKFLKFLEAHQIPATAIHLESSSVSPVYKTTEDGNQTATIDHFEVTSVTQVESKDVALINKIAQEAGSLLRDGVEIHSAKPSYYYTGIESLKIEMLGAAAADARKRAEKIATESGARVGSLRSAQQGVFQITPLYSQDISSEGEFDTSSIEKTIRAIVSVSYEIK